MTTPPSDPYETPGENQPAQPPRYGETPPPHPERTPPPYQRQPPEQVPPEQPPPGYPTGPYGQAPGYAPYGQPMAKPEPPASILQAVRLMYAGAVLSLLWTLLQPTQRDTVRDALGNPDAEVTAEDLDTFVNVAIGFAVAIGLITVGLWILMARTNRDGKTWARVVATVLGAIGILGGLRGMLQADDSIGLLIINLTLVVLAVWIIVLLYRRESSDYYNAVSQRPRY
ncbi:MAG TPA: hypothetical protein VFZ63_15240 [Jiangellaceae bacterium]